MRKLITYLFNILLLGTSIFVLFQIYKLNVLPMKLLIPIMCILLILNGIIILLSAKSKKIGSSITICLLCLVLGAGCGFGGYYLQKTNKTLETVTTTTDEDEHNISVVVLNSSNLKSINDLPDTRNGILSTTNKEVFENIHPIDYSSIQDLCTALYNHELDSIIIDEAYRESIKDIEEFTNFDTDTKVIYTYTYSTKKQETVDKVDDVTIEPFNVLITGTDSRYGVNAVSRSDVNMIATVNPQTGIVLLTSIPRDYYVPEVCDASEGCPNGQLDKLTHTGNHGMNVVKKTIESFMGIKINYTVKVSFDSVINIVNALGGIEVYVDADAATSILDTDPSVGGVNEGWQTFDGRKALAFARERHSYEIGDRQRIKNQQTVIEGIIKKATSPSIIVNYPAFMEALSGTFITDMSIEEIQSLIQYQITTGKSWSFEHYTLNGAGDWGFSAEMGRDLYMMYPDQATIETARNKIVAVLEGDSSNSIEETKHDEIEIIDGWEGY